MCQKFYGKKGFFLKNQFLKVHSFQWECLLCQPRSKTMFYKSSIEKHLSHLHKISIADYEHEFGIPAYETVNPAPRSNPSTAQSLSALPIPILRPGSHTVQTSSFVPTSVRMSNDSPSLRPAQSPDSSSLTQDTSSQPFQSPHDQGRSSTVSQNAWLQVPAFSHAVCQVAPTSLSSVAGV